MPTTIVWQKKSRYALVNCFNNGAGVVVEKEIAPDSVNYGNARWVNETSYYFRRKLHELGVLLAEPYEFSERDGRAIQRSPYVGQDLEKVFTKGGASLSLLMELILSMSGVLRQKNREVGIDARLSNFCMGPDGRVYYVDTFPPLVRYGREFIVHFPNPTDPDLVEQELRRKFDPLGIMRRLRFEILAQDAGISETDIIMACRIILGKCFAEDIEGLYATLPDHKDPDVAVTELTLDDPDSIRELALRFMPEKGTARQEYMSSIFDLSSNFCPLKITAEERLDRIRGLFRL